MKTIIVLGNDHTNTLGVIQALGRDIEAKIVACCWGNKTGLVQSSKYCNSLISASDADNCVKLIIDRYSSLPSRTPIIATCDKAAITLNRFKELLQENFVFEHATNYDFEELFKKDIQVTLALKCGFNVPKSFILDETKETPENIIFPCLIKPLESYKGAKIDIRICHSKEELEKNINTLLYTKKVLLQQYIERDYEISILGCGLKNGEVIIPCVENKLTLYPRNVGLECLSNMQPLSDESIINCIKKLIREIGYVGLFSVEMMHCKLDNKFYFTEINLRNDGANGFVYKFGVNLPLNHIEDLLGMPLSTQREYSPGYYIWEMHHTQSLLHREISIIQWVKELSLSKGFLTYFKEDKKPFYKQYRNWLLSKLKLRKSEKY